jgi:hypothetical protein
VVFVLEASAVPDFGLLEIAFSLVTGASIIGGICNPPPLEILRGT